MFIYIKANKSVQFNLVSLYADNALAEMLDMVV